MNYAPSSCFGDFTLFTQLSVPQCCRISLCDALGWQIFECVHEEAEYPAITGRALKIKSSATDSVSRYSSTGTRLHSPLCSGNTDGSIDP